MKFNHVHWNRPPPFLCRLDYLVLIIYIYNRPLLNVRYTFDFVYQLLLSLFRSCWWLYNSKPFQICQHYFWIFLLFFLFIIVYIVLIILFSIFIWNIYYISAIIAVVFLNRRLIPAGVRAEENFLLSAPPLIVKNPWRTIICFIGLPWRGHTAHCRKAKGTAKNRQFPMDYFMRL